MSLNRKGGQYIRDPDTKQTTKVEEPKASDPGLDPNSSGLAMEQSLRPEPVEPSLAVADPVGETETNPAPGAGQKKVK